MRIAQMSQSDLPAVVAAWNATLIHDQVSEDRFRQIVFDDPNYEPESVHIAWGEDGAVIGLTTSVLRRTVAGEDGGGREWELKWGFLKAFFLTDEEAADSLLSAAERYCLAAGKETMFVTEYAGPYFFPGIDLRYQQLCQLLPRHGYRDVGTIEDVAVDLRDPDLPAAPERAWRRVGTAVELLTWRPELLPAFREFVAKGDQAQWFPIGWEARYQEPMDDTLVLKRAHEIIGWAHFWPGRPTAGFGPILVLEPERGRGYGALLLLECMARARAGGAETMTAGWANTGFYTANGWHVARRYAVFVKKLGRG